MLTNTSTSFNIFLQKYPDSEYRKIAQDEVHLKIYEENTSKKSLEEYIRFMQSHPDNPYVSDAEFQIYKIQTKANTLESYRKFIENYPYNRNVDLAWKKIFQIFMYTYT